jgi:hypothetical protein
MIPNTKFTTLKGRLIRGEIEQDEFDNKIKGFKTNQKIKIVKKEKEAIQETVILKKEEKVEQKQALHYKEKSTIWWISYYVMGFIGFLATLILCMQGKFLFMKIWPKKYDEVGILGIGSDLIAYAIAFLYVWAMWNITYN